MSTVEFLVSRLATMASPTVACPRDVASRVWFPGDVAARPAVFRPGSLARTESRGGRCGPARRALIVAWPGCACSAVGRTHAVPTDGRGRVAPAQRRPGRVEDGPAGVIPLRLSTKE